MNEELFSKIVDVLTQVQQSTSLHKKYRYVLLHLYKNEQTDFYKCWEKITTVILQQDFKKPNVYVDRLIDFYSSFVTLNDQFSSEEYLYEKVLTSLLETHNLESEIIRYRSCQLLGKLLSSLDDAELDENIFENLKQALLFSIQDSNSKIRLLAVYAIYHLQEPENDNCPVISKMLIHMSGDCVAAVRKACLEKIAIRKDAIISIINRTRDINADVRMAAFKKLQKLSKYLQIIQKHRVLKNGLLDNNEQVQLFVKNNFLSAWLDNCGNDYLLFLKDLHLDSTDYYLEQTLAISERVLDALIKCRPWKEIVEVLNLNKNNLISIDDFTCECIFYWRHLTSTCRKTDNLEAYVDELLPDLVDFVTYIKEFCEKKLSDNSDNENQFVVGQLLLILRDYELVDKISLEIVNKIIKEILCKYYLNERNIDIILKNLEKSITEHVYREKYIMEILSEIICPLENQECKQDVETKILELKSLLYNLKLDSDIAVKDSNYKKAHLCEMQINELVKTIEDMQISLKNSEIVVVNNTDAETILKYLRILRGYLISYSTQTISSNLKMMLENVIEWLTNIDERVRVLALECYGLYCTIDKVTAEQGIHIFYSTLLLTNAVGCEINIHSLLVSIKAIVDILIIHGQNITSQSNNENNALFSLKDVIQLLVNLMDDENVTIQECAGRGLCTLILNGRILSPTILARLILKWCNPASEGDELLMHMNQIMEITLEEIPKIFDCINIIIKAFFITIDTILMAPKTSPLFNVNLKDVIKFMLYIFNFSKKSTEIQLQLALEICKKIESNPEEESNLLYVKILMKLRLENGYEVEELLNLCDSIIDLSDNQQVLNNIIEFQQHLLNISVNTENV